MANFNRDSSTGTIYLIKWLPMNKRLQISTHIQISDPKGWDKDKQMPVDKNLKDKKGVKVVDILAKYRSAMAEAEKEYEVTNEKLKTIFNRKLSGEIVRSRGEGTTREKFLDFFEKTVTQYEQDEKSNRKSYRTTLNNLKQFFGRRQPTFDSLDEAFFDDFKRFLEKTKDYKRNTINKQFTNIKAVANKAYSLKLHKNDYFREFRTPKEPAVNIFLSLPELEKINKLNFKNHLHLDKVRDSFILACFTGVRFNDIPRLSSAIIKEGIIRLQSSKTNEVSQIPVHRYVHEILNKYNGVAPAQLSNQKTNDHLKTICMTARLNEIYEKPFTKGGKRKSVPDKFKKWKMVSTHTARRSLCTNLILDGANPYVVMKISGHKTFDAFEKYIKLNELLAADSLKKLPMFNNTQDSKSPDKKDYQQEESISQVSEPRVSLNTKDVDIFTFTF